MWNCRDKDVRDYFESEFKITPEGEPDDDWGGRFRHLVHPTAGVVLVVALKKWAGTAEDHSILAHECLHATAHLLRRKGMTLGAETEEAFCYLIDSMVRRCLIILGMKPN